MKKVIGFFMERAASNFFNSLEMYEKMEYAEKYLTPEEFSELKRTCRETFKIREVYLYNDENNEEQAESCPLPESGQVSELQRDYGRKPDAYGIYCVAQDEAIVHECDLETLQQAQDYMKLFE